MADHEALAEAWLNAYQRVSDLVSDLADDELHRPVPATPAWTGRELLAHMVGLDADIVAAGPPDERDAAWTQSHVDARAGRTTSELLAEWQELAPRVVAWVIEHGPAPLPDVVVHEHDLRGAVGRPGGEDSPGMRWVRDELAQRWTRRVADAGLPPMALRGDNWVRVSAESPSSGWTGVVVHAGDFDLARALMSRRTADQLLGWTTSGDLTPYLGTFEVIGSLPEQPLPL